MKILLINSNLKNEFRLPFLFNKTFNDIPDLQVFIRCGVQQLDTDNQHTYKCTTHDYVGYRGIDR